ncbi:MAG: hypothetical protein CL910_15230 [Deltaproteobacteria bacterium]|jgi:hypothetical protein|nr:hypothetical protein [Deltaproteobacteria bacterium]
MRGEEVLEIRCPGCEGRATCDEPFLFLNEAPGPEEQRPTHRWGGWTVVEKFPSLVPWQAPRGSGQFLESGGSGESFGYRLGSKGVVHCARCVTPRIHELSWPGDAYWKWQIRGETLWARNRAHARKILDFVRAEHRPRRVSLVLRHIPSSFLAAKVRDEVVKKMSASLGKAG